MAPPQFQRLASSILHILQIDARWWNISRSEAVGLARAR